MKRKHKEIARMMASPPAQEATNHEKRAAKEVKELDKIDEEREKSLERIRRRKLEWNARSQKSGNMIKKDMKDVGKVEKDDKMMEVPEPKMTKEMEGQEAHTPGPRPMKHRKETLGVMTVVHTLLLGPAAAHIPSARPAVCTNLGAGINTNTGGQTQKNVWPSNVPDMRKVEGKPQKPEIVN